MNGRKERSDMKKSILIVDDEVGILESLAELLEDQADNIHTAVNGLAGIEKLENEDISLVISDINMPKMNGIQFIKEVRNRGIEVPFVFFTAHGNRELMLEAVKYGAFDFVNKPAFDDLEEIVERGFEHSFNISEKKKATDDDVISDYQQLLDSLDGEG